jgi:hypothetical protein
MAALTLGFSAATALAQSAPAPTEEPALSGPKVAPARTTTKTLIQRDFDGKFKRIDGDPVAAALDLLDLDKETRAAADRVLAERARDMDGLVKDHLREIAELANARQSGDQARARELMRDLLTTAKPILDKGPIVDQVAAALPTDKAAELKRIVEEYVQAGIGERMNGDGADTPRRRTAAGGKPTKFQASLAERLQEFGGELKRSYERVFGNRAADFQKLVKDLGLSPEVESKVQQIFTDLFQKTYGKPTKAQSTKAFFEAYALMTPEQRAKLRERFAPTPSDPDRPAGESPKPPSEVPTPKDEMGKP